MKGVEENPRMRRASTERQSNDFSYNEIFGMERVNSTRSGELTSPLLSIDLFFSTFYSHHAISPRGVDKINAE